ncbi:hypothetical protein GCM10009761_31370 [Agromyces terreus]
MPALGVDTAEGFGVGIADRTDHKCFGNNVGAHIQRLSQAPASDKSSGVALWFRDHPWWRGFAERLPVARFGDFETRRSSGLCTAACREYLRIG